MERDQRGLAVSDLQKINKELEKLQESDDDSVFSNSPGSVSGTAPENVFGTKAREYQLAEERQVRQRRHSGHREARDSRAQSPAVSLRIIVPSPSPHHRARVSPGDMSNIVLRPEVFHLNPSALKQAHHLRQPNMWVHTYSQ